jgi:pimeloyl-ACP methyl ester carboxylesterase
VIRVDLSGHGDTPAHGRSHWTIQGRAAFVVAFMEALDLRDVTLIGHSIGGPVVMEVALLVPERVRGVGLLSSIGITKHRLLRNKPVRVVSWVLSMGPLRTVLMPGLRAGMQAAGFSRHTPDQEAVDSVHVISRVDFHRRGEVVAALAAAGVPTFATWAEDDPIIEPAVFQELADAVPPGPRLAFKDGHHNPQKTHAVEIGEALLTWMGS